MFRTGDYITGTHVHTCTQTHMRSSTYTHIYICIYTFTHTHILIHTHTHTHAHNYIDFYPNPFHIPFHNDNNCHKDKVNKGDCVRSKRCIPKIYISFDNYD